MHQHFNETPFLLELKDEDDSIKANNANARLPFDLDFMVGYGTIKFPEEEIRKITNEDVQKIKDLIKKKKLEGISLNSFIKGEVNTRSLRIKVADIKFS